VSQIETGVVKSPRFDTLVPILGALGLELRVERSVPRAIGGGATTDHDTAVAELAGLVGELDRSTPAGYTGQQTAAFLRAELAAAGVTELGPWDEATLAAIAHILDVTHALTVASWIRTAHDHGHDAVETALEEALQGRTVALAERGEWRATVERVQAVVATAYCQCAGEDTDPGECEGVVCTLRQALDGEQFDGDGGTS
jgi:transposase-like protein